MFLSIIIYISKTKSYLVTVMALPAIVTLEKKGR